MRRLSTMIAAFAALTLATPAAAQLGGGRSGSSTDTYFSNEAAQQEVVNFGRCFARKNTPSALRLVATEPGTREEANVFRALFQSEEQECLRFVTWLKSSPQMLRGTIGEGLYYSRIALPPEMLMTAPDVSAVRDLSGAARCYVKANEAQARELAETKPHSRKEKALMEAVVPNFMKCMPAGVPLNYPITMVRFRIVEAMFRMGLTRAEAAGN